MTNVNDIILKAINTQFHPSFINKWNFLYIKRFYRKELSHSGSSGSSGISGSPGSGISGGDSGISSGGLLGGGVYWGFNGRFFRREEGFIRRLNRFIGFLVGQINIGKWFHNKSWIILKDVPSKYPSISEKILSPVMTIIIINTLPFF